MVSNKKACNNIFNTRENEAFILHYYYIILINNNNKDLIRIYMILELNMVNVTVMVKIHHMGGILVALLI